MKCGMLGQTVNVNGTTLAIGDVISCETEGVHFAKLCRMAFLGHSDDGRLMFLFPLETARFYQHDGHFEPQQLRRVKKELSVEDAIPREFRCDPSLRYLDRVIVKATRELGTVIAAVSCTIAVVNASGEIIIGLESGMIERTNL